MTTHALPGELWCAGAGHAPAAGWVGLHDQVMGGRSSGIAQWIPADAKDTARLRLTGWVSLDHGGGFASFRLSLVAPHRLGEARSLELVLRGDGGAYKCCLHRHADREGVQWQTGVVAPRNWTRLVLPLSDFVARRRSKTLDERAWQPDDILHQIGILAVRAEPGPFELYLARMALA